MTIAHEPAGAELASLLISSLRFRKPDGVKVPGLRHTDDAMQEWLDLKFGLFVHWGLYAIVGRGEWHMFMDWLCNKTPPASVSSFRPISITTWIRSCVWKDDEASSDIMST